MAYIHKYTMAHTIGTGPDGHGSVAILIRHAERYPIDVMSNALQPLLTDKGKSDARSLGERLSRYSPVTLYHSPVQRCVETAECIREGIERSNKMARIGGYLLELGGPYLTGSWDMVVNCIEELGHTMFIRKWFNNELPDAILMPLAQAAELQLNILVDQLRSGAGSTINVTHDWNIMMVREYYFNLRHEEIGDPDYLDGVWAHITDGALHLRYHEHEKIMPLPQRPS